MLTRASDDAVQQILDLHRRHYVALVRLAAILVGSRAAAEDIVQDMFTHVLQRPNILPTESNQLRYLKAGVLNRARNELRSQSVRHRLETANDQFEVSAEELAIVRQSRTRVRQAIGLLPYRQQEVVVLLYLDDLSIAEAARILGINQTAVRASSRRARIALTTLLGAEHGR